MASGSVQTKGTVGVKLADKRVTGKAKGNTRGLSIERWRGMGAGLCLRKNDTWKRWLVMA